MDTSNNDKWTNKGNSMKVKMTEQKTINYPIDFDLMKLIDTQYYQKKRTTASLRVYTVKEELLNLL